MLFQDSPEFDLVFDNAVDQWVANSSAEKCLFVQILYHACQTYWEGKPGGVKNLGKLGKAGQQRRASQYAHPDSASGPSVSSASRSLQTRRMSFVPPRQTEFINCQSKLTGGSGRWLLLSFLLCYLGLLIKLLICCPFRCLLHESGHLPLQSLLESCEEGDSYKPKYFTISW